MDWDRSKCQLDKFIEEELLGQRAYVFVIFLGAVNCPSVNIVLVYTPTTEVWECLFSTVSGKCVFNCLIFHSLDISACLVCILLLWRRLSICYVLEPSVSTSISSLEFWGDRWLWAGPWPQLKAGRPCCCPPPRLAGECLREEVACCAFHWSAGRCRNQS